MFSILGSICEGDKTSCGGVVVSGRSFATVDGRAIACKGDRIICQHNCTIIDGNEHETFDGAHMALHGARTSKGCVCLSSNNDIHGDGQDADGLASVPAAADAGIAYMPDTAKLLNEEQWVAFKLVDQEDAPIRDQAFELIDPTGKLTYGKLDANGFARVEPVKAGACTVYFLMLGYTMTVGA